MPRVISVVAAGLCLSALAVLSCGEASGGGAASAAANAGEPDYAARAREVIRSHQPDPDGVNAWPEFVRLCHVAEGAVMLFSTEPNVQAWLATQDPEAAATGTDLLRAVLDGSDEVGDEERDAVAAFLERLEQTELLQQLDELVEAEAIVPSVNSPLMGRRAPWLGGARVLATICAARMVDAHADRDVDEVLRSLRHLQAIERGASCELGIISLLVAIAVRDLTMRTIAAMAREHELSPALAARLGEAMDNHAFLALDVTVETERLMLLETISRTYARLDQAADAAGAGGAAALPPVRGLKSASKDEALDIINTYMDGFRDCVGDDPAKVQEGWAAMHRFELEFAEENRAPHVALVGMVLPHWSRVRTSARRGEAVTAGVRTMLAIERFEAERGRLPSSLDELVLAPGYLAALPADPFVDGDGAPLSYRTLEGQADEHGRSYLLYTVGSDREDNGGKISPRSMVNAWSNAGRGYDFVFNHPEWE